MRPADLSRRQVDRAGDILRADCATPEERAQARAALGSFTACG